MYVLFFQTHACTYIVFICNKFTSLFQQSIHAKRIMRSYRIAYENTYLLKTKNKLTVFISQKFYSCFDLIKMKYFNWVPRLAQTDFIKYNSCKWFHYRVICAVIKKKHLAFSHKFLSRPGIWTKSLKWPLTVNKIDGQTFGLYLAVNKWQELEIVSQWNFLPLD